MIYDETKWVATQAGEPAFDNALWHEYAVAARSMYNRVDQPYNLSLYILFQFHVSVRSTWQRLQ